MFAALLIGVLMLRKPCAQGTANFMEGFEAPVDATVQPDPKSGFVRISGEETEQELREKLRDAPRYPQNQQDAAPID